MIEHYTKIVTNLMQVCGMEQDANKMHREFKLSKPTSGKSRPIIVKETDRSIKKVILNNVKKVLRIIQHWMK